MQRAVSVLAAFGAGVVELPGIVNVILSYKDLKPRRVVFRVVPDDAQSVNVILGRSFTEALDLTYTRYGYDLTFSEIDPTLFSDDEQAKVRLYANENVKLAPDLV